MLISAEVAEQQTFSVVHAADPGRVYCLGVEGPSGVLTVWLDPHTGKPTFGCYLNIQDAMTQLSYKLGRYAPLELATHEPAEYTNLECCYDEVVLVKASTWNA